MGTLVTLVAKFGVAALPVILSEYGLFAAIFAFFAFMPLGHFTIGILLVIVGAFIPKVPEPEQTHAINVGGGHSTFRVDGSARTVLFAVGALVVAGSFFEAVR